MIEAARSQRVEMAHVELGHFARLDAHLLIMKLEVESK